MSESIVDEYFRLTRPNDHAEMEAAFFRGVGNLSITPDMLVSVEANWRELVKSHIIGEHEAELESALGRAGMTIDDLVDMRFQRLAQRRAGRLPPQSRNRMAMRQTALKAIHDADLAGMAWGEAIEFVQSEVMARHKREQDRKTLDAWMRELHAFDLVKITPPAARRRGRPKKE